MKSNLLLYACLIAAVLTASCERFSPRSQPDYSAPQYITAEGTAHPDEEMTTKDNADEPALLDDIVFQNLAKKDFEVRYEYNRIEIPEFPELEELRTVASARARLRQHLAREIWQTPLEKRARLGQYIAPSPELKKNLERAIDEQGKWGIKWNQEETKVRASLTLPGAVVVNLVTQNLRKHQPTVGAPGYKDVSPEQRRRLARDRAIENARDALRERLMAHTLSGNRTIAEQVRANPRLRYRVESFIDSAPLESVIEQPDGSIKATIRVDLRRVLDLM